MTPNENLHALLLAFNDAVKKLVHEAASSDDSVAAAIDAAVKDERNNANKFAAACAKVVEQLEAERERSAKLVGFLKSLRFFTKDSALLGIVERAITEYESQSK